MEHSFYGFRDQNSADSPLACHVEEVAIKGYSVIPDVLSPPELELLRARIDAIYAQQEREFGRQALVDIQELDACRAPLLYDFGFAEYARNPTVLAVVRQLLGDWVILNLQNAVINRPSQAHHQSSWHRDLPYQNFVISRPLAVNALWVVDDFSAESGGTSVLPFTHKQEVLPSGNYIANNSVVMEAKAGAVVIFDAMLIHRAGANRSAGLRRALNHMYTIPILKQQYDFPRALAARQSEMDADLQRLLGFTAQVPLDDREWRLSRAARLGGVRQ